MQALPTLAATGIGGIGGVSKELVARLAFDLVDLHSRHQSRLVGAPRQDQKKQPATSP